MSLLPSPPPQPPSSYSLPHSPGLNPSQIESLRSSVDQARVAIQELTRMVDLGGEQGIVGWPTLLSSYQNLLSLLGLVAHHLNPPPPSTNPFALNHHQSGTRGGPLVNPLTQLLVHPLVGIDPTEQEWAKLLMLPPPSLHTAPPPPPPTGTPEDHVLRLDRARRVCSLLEEKMMWRGRVGLVAPDETESSSSDEEDDDEEEEQEEEEDIFGSDEDDAMDGSGKKEGGKGKGKGKGKDTKEKVLKEKELSREEREKELKRLVGFMVRGGGE